MPSVPEEMIFREHDEKILPYCKDAGQYIENSKYVK